jgi:hypothetical protein
MKHAGRPIDLKPSLVANIPKCATGDTVSEAGKLRAKHVQSSVFNQRCPPRRAPPREIAFRRLAQEVMQDNASILQSAGHADQYRDRPKTRIKRAWQTPLRATASAEKAQGQW